MECSALYGAFILSPLPAKLNYHCKGRCRKIGRARGSGHLQWNGIFLSMTGLLYSCGHTNCDHKLNLNKIKSAEVPVWKREGSSSPTPCWGAIDNWQLLAEQVLIFFKAVPWRGYTCSHRRSCTHAHKAAKWMQWLQTQKHIKLEGSRGGVGWEFFKTHYMHIRTLKQ